MRRNGKLRRLLSMIMAVAVLLSVIPWTVIAADGDTVPTYTKITSAEELTDGQYVMMVSTGYAPLELDSTWVTAVQPTVEGDTVTDAQGAVWTITATDTGVILTDSNGTSIAPKGGDTNGITAGEYSWAVSAADGQFTFSGQGSDTVALASNTGFENKFRAYKTNTISNNPNGYPSTFTLYKLDEGTDVEEPSEDPSESTQPTESPSEPETVTIADGTYVIWQADAGKAMSAHNEGYSYGYAPAADVTMADGALSGYTNNEIYTIANTSDGKFTITDVYGRQLYMTGSFDSFNLSAAPTSGNEWMLKDAGDGTYYVYNVEMNKYIQYTSYGNFGAYNYSNGEGKLTLVTVTPMETEPEQTTPEVPTGVADGDYVIWAPAYNMALSSVYGGYYNNGVDVALDGDTLTGYGATEIWTVTNNDDGTITISYGGQNLAMADSRSSMTLGEKNDTWVLKDAGDGLYYVKNTVRECYIEWYAEKNNWSGYTYINAGSEGMFALKFTPAEEVEEAADGIADGDYVIWAPDYNKALSSVYGGYYNNGVDVALDGDTLTGYGATEIWTVTNNDDGTICLTYGGQNLAMADSRSSMTLGEKNDTWVLEDAGDDLYYVKNTVRECYIEWYAEKNNWSGYAYINAGSEGMFALKFTPAEAVYATDSAIVKDIAQWGGGGIYDESTNASVIQGDRYISGDQKDDSALFTVVANGTQAKPYQTSTSTTTGGTNYYMGGTGIGSTAGDYAQFAVNTAGWGDMTLAFRIRATKAAPGSFQLCYSTDNGATWQNFSAGSYAYAYTQYTSDGSYPVTGSGSVGDGIVKTSMAPTFYISFSFDVPDGAENCKDLLIRLVPGSGRADGGSGAVSGNIRIDSVVLSGSPIVDNSITSYVTVTPNGDEDQPVGTALTMTSEEGAVIYYRVNGGQWQTYDETNKPTLDTLPCDIEAYASSEGKANSVTLLYHYAAGTVAAVKMDPNGGGVYIAGDGTNVTMTSATEGAAIYYMTSPDGEIWPEEWTEYTEALNLQKGFGKLYVKAYAVKAGFNDSAVVTRTFTERSTTTYSLYFGQLHSHTNISDGAGSITEAFEHASKVQNLDFLAVTDHSNSFDNTNDGSLSVDGAAVSDEWAEAKAAAEAITSDTFVGLYGFEMTWSNGLGHMNTFNTPGWQSRTQSDYTTYGTALQNYYNTLTTVPESISQFNHPGTTFGDFSDFAHYTEVYDELITLIEVGNGEGEIGSSGYFPSYEYYTRALDKGWHVAPTNNQDNHKGNWGDSNTGRSVVLTDSLTEEGIYDALRNYRVYATEDNDLNIYYTLEGQIMGSILDLEAGEEITLKVQLSDATDASIGKVEVIVNGGLTAASTTVSGNSETVTFTLNNDYSYYYIKVTEADGDIAVTAPVWTGEVEAAGISSFTTDAALPVQNQEMNLTLDLYNNESTDMTIESIVFTIGDEVIHTADLTNLSKVAKLSTASYSFAYAHDGLGQTEIYATVTATLNGVQKVYKEKLDLTFVTPNMVTRVVVDGTHYNDYVTGYYGGNMSNLTSIAAESQIEVNVVTDQITAEILENCDLLIISAPARKAGTANAGPYTASSFEDDFIQLVTDYVKAGGSVILCGLADYQDKNAVNGAEGHAAAQLNKLLAAIGSTMSINDDEVYDTENNGGQAYRMYPENFNMDSQWCAGIVTNQTYSQYSGCSVNVGQGTWLVKGFETTCSVDSDKDGVGNTDQILVDGSYTYNIVVPEGEVVFLACEDTAYGGTIFVAGGVFVSDFEVKAELDNIWDLPYANRTIIENIMGAVRTELPLSTIAEVRQGDMDEVFRIRGYVTAGTDNENTTFFDAIYVQDETGGITVFPFSASGVAIGTPIEIIGYVDEYQGDKEIQIMSYTILDTDAYVWQPEMMNNADAMDYANNGGKLIQVQGEVVEVLYSGDTGVAQFVVKDENGDLAKVFIDGYILSATTGENTLASTVKVGNVVSAVGLLYWHPEGDNETGVAVLRVRNCDEVILLKAAEETPGEDPTEPPVTDPSETTEPTQSEETTEATQPTTKPSTGDNSNTGDDSAILLTMTVMFGALAALAVVLLNRKRFV